MGRCVTPMAWRSFSAAPLSTKMKEFYGKDKVTICVTDVGLGGLSVLSEVDKLLRKQPIFPEAELFYFNAGVRPATQNGLLKTKSQYSTQHSLMASHHTNLTSS